MHVIYGHTRRQHLIIISLAQTDKLLVIDDFGCPLMACEHTAQTPPTPKTHPYRTPLITTSRRPAAAGKTPRSAAGYDGSRTPLGHSSPAPAVVAGGPSAAGQLHARLVQSLDKLPNLRSVSGLQAGAVMATHRCISTGAAAHGACASVAHAPAATALVPCQVPEPPGQHAAPNHPPRPSAHMSRPAPQAFQHRSSACLPCASRPQHP